MDMHDGTYCFGECGARLDGKGHFHRDELYSGSKKCRDSIDKFYGEIGAISAQDFDDGMIGSGLVDLVARG
tara:strand:- start:3508 stop:3720 length:213 start_codon:yes stop_codon:yes gene_type:complete